MFEIQTYDEDFIREQKKKKEEMKKIREAVLSGNIEEIKETMANYNYKYKEVQNLETKQNLLFDVCSTYKDDEAAIEVSKFLIEQGVVPEEKDLNRQTCLFYACMSGLTGLCEFLITERNLFLNEGDYINQTPLYYAAREGYVDIIKMLCNNGADVNHIDDFGQNCIFYAVQNGQIEAIKLLLELGVNVNKRDNLGNSPLMLAERNKNWPIVELLVQYGAIRYEQKGKTFNPKKKIYPKSPIKKVKTKQIKTVKPKDPEHPFTNVHENFVKQKMPSTISAARTSSITATNSPKTKKSHHQKTASMPTGPNHDKTHYVLVRNCPGGKKEALSKEEIVTLIRKYPEFKRLLGSANKTYVKQN